METINNYFLQQGILGVIIVMLIGVVIWQQKRIDIKDKQIIDLQDKRVADTNGYTNSYALATKEMVGTSKDIVNAVNLLQRSVDALATAFQGFINRKK